MKKYSIAIFVLVSIFYIGCSKTNENKIVSNTVPTPSVENSVNAGVPAPANAQTPLKTRDEMEKINREIFNSGSNSKSNTQSRLPQNRAQSENSLNSRPAPDNSIFSSAMDEKGRPLEIRTFINNPLILKVEKVGLTSDKKVIKVYLKNGKIVELQEEEIPNFAIASVGSILSGVEAKNKK